MQKKILFASSVLASASLVLALRATQRDAAAAEASLAARQAAAAPARQEPIRMGAGPQRYEWVRDWLELPEKKDIGNTHGGIVVDSKGCIYLNTDTTRAILVYSPAGKFLRSFGEDLAGGVHGMLLAKEGDAEFLYLVHHARNEARKLTLEGKTVWTLSWPQESGKYAKADEYHPTSLALAPGGDLFVADGYGKSWVHRYDKDRKYVASFGGPGSEPGQMHTPHGLAIDTRTQPPTLLVADRENHRLEVFDLEGRFLRLIEGLRRPCSIDVQGEYLAVADLAGRVTILDGKNQVVAQLGDNPDESLRAENGVPREKWVDGLFTAPHSAKWDAEGNLYVMDWNYLGRINKLRRVRD